LRPFDAGARPDDDHSRLIPRGDPLLAAVDHVIIAVAAGGGAQRARIGTRVGFGEAETRRDETAGSDLGQVPALLRVAAESIDGVGATVVHRYGHRRGGATLGDLHHRERIRDRAGVRAAIFLGV